MLSKSRQVSGGRSRLARPGFSAAGELPNGITGQAELAWQHAPGNVEAGRPEFLVELEIIAARA
jgi:hypothetical protein